MKISNLFKNFVLSKNLKELDINFIITNTAVETFIKSSINTYDIVFYDPPFEMGSDKVENEINNLVEITRVDSFVVVHRHKASSEIEFSKNYEIHREKNYGQSKIIILRKL